MEDLTFSITGDGSPTLVQTKESTGINQAMHSRKGAFLETVYISGPAIQWAFEKMQSPNFLVVGLGLGYIEMLIAALWRSEFFARTPHVVSYESNPTLRDLFLQWVKSDSNRSENPYFEKYHQIALRFSEFFGLPYSEFRYCLRYLLSEEKLQVKGAFGLDDPEMKQRFSSILYDPYSTEFCPELWEEKHLLRLLSEWTAPSCSFATYARTGNLKRSLDKCGFTMEERPGFGGKRQCTLAMRSTKTQQHLPPSPISH